MKQVDSGGRVLHLRWVLIEAAKPWRPVCLQWASRGSDAAVEAQVRLARSWQDARDGDVDRLAIDTEGRG